MATHADCYAHEFLASIGSLDDEAEGVPQVKGQPSLASRLAAAEAEAGHYKALYEDEKARADGLELQLALLMGEAAKAPAPRSSIAPELERNALADVLAQSSLKQRAYFVALVMGHSYEQIATATGVAQTTVLLQVQKVLRRLGVSGNLKGLRERADEYRHHLAQGGVQDAIGVRTNWLVAPDPVFIAGLSPVMKCMPPSAPKKGLGQQRLANRDSKEERCDAAPAY